jgi:hypothetical protein
MCIPLLQGSTPVYMGIWEYGYMGLIGRCHIDGLGLIGVVHIERVGLIGVVHIWHREGGFNTYIHTYLYSEEALQCEAGLGPVCIGVYEYMCIGVYVYRCICV